MPDDTWQKMREIFDSALRRPLEERPAYLEEACGGDKLLLAEVQSLFNSLDSAESFMETPAVAAVADALETDTKKLEQDAVLGHYEIIRQIGAGGMGEVYLAKDKKLDREVAVKLLNEKFSRDESNLHRFTREAKAASALNHPNILIIHEIGEENKAHYIVSEYIKGETLREILREKTLKLSEILDIAIQTANALVAAHEARLIHRDIKPENIMLRPDGFVKVLDFGLAKLVERQNISILGLEESTLQQSQTAKGIILGTVNYMSPEQAKGERVDERTDIFSFGVVLYEMVTGRTPFQGDSMPETLANLINAEPPPFSQLAGNVPDELQRIVTKTLRKNKDARYQTIKGLLADLKELRENLTLEQKLARSAKSKTGETVQMQATTGNANLQTAETQSSFSGFIKRRKFSVILSVFIFISIVVGIGYGLYSYIGQFQIQPPKELKMTMITNSGKADKAVISPDGKYIAYASFVGDKQSVRVRHVETTSEIEIVPPSAHIYGLTFSPDNNYIYYVKTQDDNKYGIGILYRIPVLGGVSEKLVYDIDSAVGFSPDGKRIAFIRGYPKGNKDALLTATLQGADERQIAVRNLNNGLNHNPDSLRFYQPAWSPDGKIIACSMNNQVGDEFYQTIIGIRAEDGTEIPISSKRWRWIDRMEWLSDQKGLIITAGEIENPSDRSQIWHIPFPGGEPRRVTNDTDAYHGVSLTADSRTLVTILQEGISSISVAPVKAKTARRISSGKHDGYNFFDWTPDGKILFTTTGAKNSEFWIMEADGSGRKQLSGAGIFPKVTSDGRYVVYKPMYAEGNGLRKMNIESGEVSSLTGNTVYGNCLSPDGKWVVFATRETPENSIWKVPIEGGEPILIIKKLSATPYSISPDGKFLAYLFEEGDDPLYAQRKTGIMPFEGGETFKYLNHRSYYLHWLPDSSGLSYLDTVNGVTNIWKLPLDGGEPKQITNFESENFDYFLWSRDGSNVALRHIEEISDVVLIRDFR